MGINVGKDAGIAIGSSTLIGIAINFCYVAMYKSRLYTQNLTSILQEAFSRPLASFGWVILSFLLLVIYVI